MYRLTREIRFAIDLTCREGRPIEGRNGYAGKPPVTGLGQVYYALAVTVRGEPGEGDGYIVNIKDVDGVVRDKAVPLVKQAVRRVALESSPDGGGGIVREVYDALQGTLAPHVVDAVELKLSPLTRLAVQGTPPMTYLKHTFDFAASHRLNNPDRDEAENRRVFGKCNNVHGHGHNYQVEVSLAGTPDADGFLIDLYELERIVDEAVITPLDHKNLNVEVEEFMDAAPGRLNPSVEHIAKVVFDRLRPRLTFEHARLDAVTVWETPKTWCEYRA